MRSWAEREGDLSRAWRANTSSTNSAPPVPSNASQEGRLEHSALDGQSKCWGGRVFAFRTICPGGRYDPSWIAGCPHEQRYAAPSLPAGMRSVWRRARPPGLGGSLYLDLKTMVRGDGAVLRSGPNLWTPAGDGGRAPCPFTTSGRLDRPRILIWGGMVGNVSVRDEVFSSRVAGGTDPALAVRTRASRPRCVTPSPSLRRPPLRPVPTPVAWRTSPPLPHLAHRAGLSADHGSGGRIRMQTIFRYVLARSTAPAVRSQPACSSSPWASRSTLSWPSRRPTPAQSSSTMLDIMLSMDLTAAFG